MKAHNVKTVLARACVVGREGKRKGRGRKGEKRCVTLLLIVVGR